MKYAITVRSTSITVSPGKESMDLLRPLLKLLEYEDEMTEETVALGYMLDTDKDVLYLHKGVDLKYLQRLLINVEFINDPYDEYKPMNFEYEEIIPPRNEEQVGVINFISGEDDYSSNVNDRQIFLVKQPGFGKMEPYSRKIPAPYSKSGYIKMGDIKIGDYIFDANGKPTLVTNIFDHGEQDVYEVTFNDNRTAYCGKEHLWKLKRIQSDSWKTIALNEILDDYKNNMYEIPICEPVQYHKQDVPIDPWVLGCIINIGIGNDQLSVYTLDSELANKIADICGFDVMSDGNLYYKFYKHGNPVNAKEFYKGIIDFTHPSIPDMYLVNSIDMRMRLLQGLIDSGGYIDIDDGYNVCYSGINGKSHVFMQVMWLLNSLGFTYSHHDGCYGCKPYLIIKVPNIMKPNLFTTPYKSSVAVEASKVIDDFEPHLIITDISKYNREKCRCLMVDNEDHLYLTEDFIVTHNTFCSSVGLCKFNAKTLIIMHREALREQWLKSLYKMTGFSSREVHEITSSEEVADIVYGRCKMNYDVYLMTHATFRAGLKRLNTFSDMRNLTKNLGIGMKIIDEAHLEFRNILLIDFLFNVCRNLYLTATDGRSDKDENSIFKMVFSNANYYRKHDVKPGNTPTKWVNYVRIEVNSHCSSYTYKYRVNGMRGMSAITYGKWVINNDKKQTHFKLCRDLLRDIYERDSDAKVIIFMPLIDLCEDVAHFCRMSLNYDESFDLDLNIKTINSHNSKSENERNKHADVIVTTIISCGTGTDIPGITDIICCNPFYSSITAKQVFGRLRYCGKICHYYDITDASIPMDKVWLKNRVKTLSPLALNANQILTWYDDSNNNKTN